jgi:hypothetical protein
MAKTISSQKKKRGRKAGGVSFMQVNLNELNRILRPDAHVIVSLRFAQIVGLEGKPVSATLDVMSAAAAGATADYTFTNWEDGEEDGQESKGQKGQKGQKEKKGGDPDEMPAQFDVQCWDDEE